MIFAAGLGTRLRPLTDTLPKALIPVAGVPMLERIIRRLESFGFHDIIINVHHFAEHIIDFLHSNHNFGINIQVSHERDVLLDTGGGLKYAAWFFDDDKPFLVHNVDILTDLDLGDFYRTHLQSSALATLAVKQRPGSRFLLFNREHVLCGWKNTATGEVKMSRPIPEIDLIPLAFSGIHVIDPEIFTLMPEQQVFSMTPWYLDLASHHTILAYRHDDSLWLDIGKKESLIQAEKIVRHLYGE